MQTLRVLDILNHPSASLPVEESWQFDDLQTDGAIHSRLRIERNTVGFRINGTLEGTINLCCDRCLQEYEKPVTIDLSEEYVVQGTVKPAQPKRGSQQEVQLESFYEELDEMDELDLKDLAHQWLLIEQSGQHLCGRTDCRLNI